MILVDKDQKNKSIFSIGDFRHNIANGEEAKKFSSQVKQEPKNLLAWNDFSVYNPKVSRDTTFIPKYKKIDNEKKENKNLILNKLKTISEEVK